MCYVCLVESAVYKIHEIDHCIPHCVQVPPNIPSIGELKKSLPDHCFTPSLSLSFYYVLKDLVIMTLLYVSMLALTEGKNHRVLNLTFITVKL